MMDTYTTGLTERMLKVAGSSSTQLRSKTSGFRTESDPGDRSLSLHASGEPDQSHTLVDPTCRARATARQFSASVDALWLEDDRCELPQQQIAANTWPLTVFGEVIADNEKADDRPQQDPADNEDDEFTGGLDHMRKGVLIEAHVDRKDRSPKQGIVKN